MSVIVDKLKTRKYLISESWELNFEGLKEAHIWKDNKKMLSNISLR